MVSAYFDESSEGDSKNGLLAVCGYVLDMAGVDGLMPEWKRMLDEYRLPYFHMVECNSCTGVYDHLDDEGCDRCAREAIRIARLYPLHGHAFVLNQTEYRDILQDRGFDCDPYSFMVWSAFLHVNKWVDQNRPDEKISLFFESGYRTQRRANELLQAATQDALSGRNRVSSYTFVRKEDSEPTQAADLVAWHIRKGYENFFKGKPIRKDTEALIHDKRILTIPLNADLLKNIRDGFLEKAGSLERASETIFSQNVIVA